MVLPNVPVAMFIPGATFIPETRVVFFLHLMSVSHDIFRKVMAIKMLLSNVKWKKRRKEFNSIQFLGSKSHKVGKTVLSNVSQSKA